MRREEAARRDVARGRQRGTFHRQRPGRGAAVAGVVLVPGWPPRGAREAHRPRSAHPKVILSLLLQLLRAQVRHALAPVSVLAATSASPVGRSPPPAPPRPPSPWRRGPPRLPPGAGAGEGTGGAGRSHRPRSGAVIATGRGARA